jgi:putative ABC transport system ATP-binding protein
MELFVQLNQDSKTTVILVTHEQDIAGFSKRIIRFLDGHILSDQPVVRK